MEIWKPVKDYDDYRVSNLGNIKSLKYGNEKTLNFSFDKCGYKKISLTKNGVQKTKRIHQLVAISFLNHSPCGLNLVVNHINGKRDDNRLENLEIITQRENSNRKLIKSSSKYTGVSFNKKRNNWISKIYIKGKSKHLGCFLNEIDAHNAYQKEIQKINNN
jgi:hypothetical protein